MKWSLVPLAAIVVTVCGCGSPDDGRSDFVFDPVPVVTSFDGRVVYVDLPSCAVFAADEFAAIVERESLPDFEAWLVVVGFETTDRKLSPDDADLTIRVPAGSVPAAVRAAERRPGVIAAAPNPLSIYDRSPPTRVVHPLIDAGCGVANERNRVVA